MKSIQAAAQELVERNKDLIEEFAKIHDEEAGIELANMIARMFIAGATSDAAKAYHTKDTYTIEQISELFAGEGSDGGYFDDWLDYRLETNSKISFKAWFKQNKK